MPSRRSRDLSTWTWRHEAAGRERVSQQRENNVVANRQLLGRCDLGGPWEVGGKYSAQAPISGASMEGADPLPASVGVSG